MIATHHHSLRSLFVTFSAFLLGLSQAAPRARAQDAATFSIRKYLVQGTKQLSRLEVETAVYPYLGPGRTVEDIEQARAALEKAYKDKGFQTVGVDVPQQDGTHGVIILQAVEAPVGRLRVKGSRFFDIERIKRKAPSMAEGKVPNFNDVTKDILALNKLADRKVTPKLEAGVVPGTVDINLIVEDKLPLHGSLELNNRYSPDTTELRLNGSLSYGNLWQLGHTLGANFQIAPERMEDAKVFSAYYLAPLSDDWSLMLQTTKQDSNVSTLGGAAVVGRGDIYGLRFLRTLPSRDHFYHSLSFGLDYKHFGEDVAFAGQVLATPITYWPFTVSYSASWAGEKSDTDLNAAINFHARGMGSDIIEFDNKRYNSTGSYLYFRSDIARTQQLPKGFELYAKVQGQMSSAPLINSEQFAGGGLNTVRGYLESAALGDYGIFGTLELRSPSLLKSKDNDKPDHEWRLYGFIDGGKLALLDPLPEQQTYFNLMSVGVGSSIRLWNHLNGSFDLGFPLEAQSTTAAGDALLTFRFWADF